MHILMNGGLHINVDANLRLIFIIKKNSFITGNVTVMPRIRPTFTTPGNDYVRLDFNLETSVTV